MMNLGFGNGGGGDRRLCALECNQLKSGGCRESRLSVKRRGISIVKKYNIEDEPLLDPRNE